MRTRNQELAARIFIQISRLPIASHESYGRLAQKLPVLIYTAGFTQAITFAESKHEEGGGRELLSHLAVTLGFDTPSDLSEFARSTENLADYMLLTKRALDALIWYKRFSQSVLGIAPGGDE